MSFLNLFSLFTENQRKQMGRNCLKISFHQKTVLLLLPLGNQINWDQMNSTIVFGSYRSKSFLIQMTFWLPPTFSNLPSLLYCAAELQCSRCQGHKSLEPPSVILFSSDILLEPRLAHSCANVSYDFQVGVVTGLHLIGTDVNSLKQCSLDAGVID